MSESIQSEWVLAKYKGEKAVQQEALAQAGVGYILVDSSGTGKNREIIVAFRRIVDGPRPDHLTPVSWDKVKEYEKTRIQRQGLTIRD